MNSNSNTSGGEFAGLIGLDWGDASHAVVLFDCSSNQIEPLTLIHSPEKVRSWLNDLETRFCGKPVALAIETSKGPLIHLFCDVPWLTIYPIHPATSARYRKAFSPSGAKDDQPDAHVLLDLLRSHRQKLRPLVPEDEQTRRLAKLCELRRKTVDHRTDLTNELCTLLKEYFPQGLDLVGEVLYSPLAVDFLDRWPDLLTLKAAKPATIKRFYYQHNVRRPEAIEQRLALVASAVALTTDQAVVSVCVRQLKRLIQQLRVVQNHIRSDEQEIAAAFKAHPDAILFNNLPGAGAALAPVKEKSGGRVWIHWRWNAPRFLRQTVIEWAGQTVFYCLWAKAFYDQQRARGKRHWAILRALAFKWIRILWKCWRTRQPYDEDRYLQSLLKRKSSLIANAT